jgi:hypothetical protein
MEYWNIGILGFDLKNRWFSHYSIIPTFHDSKKFHQSFHGE